MPEWLHRKLVKQATNLARSGKLKARGKYKKLKDAKNAYVYSVIRKYQEAHGGE